MYCVPVPPASDAAAIVCEEPVVQLKLQGALQDTPSTVNVNPTGELVTPIATVVPCSAAVGGLREACSGHPGLTPSPAYAPRNTGACRALDLLMPLKSRLYPESLA